MPPSHFPSLSIPPPLSLSPVYLFSYLLLSFCSPFSFSLALSRTYTYCRLFSSAGCTPFLSSNHLPNAHLPAARFCLTSLPLYSLFFSPSSNCSPVQPRVSPFISQHSNLPSPSLRSSTVILHPSFAAYSILYPFSALVLLLRFSRCRRFILPSPADSLGLHSCLRISIHLGKASFSAVFSSSAEFGALLSQPLYFYLPHLFLRLSFSHSWYAGSI